MKLLVNAVLVASVVLLGGCATSGPHYAHLSTFDQFPINAGRSSSGQALIKVVAVVPGAGELADAVGAELGKRGFTVITAAEIATMLGEVDFRGVYEHHAASPQYLEQVGRMGSRLRPRGVDALLVIRSGRFEPRPFREYPYFQQAEYAIHLTTSDPGAGLRAAQAGGWVNIDKRPRSAADAAVEVVRKMATRVSNPL